MTPGPKGWFYMIRNWADRDTLDRDAVITACNQAIDEMNRSKTIELRDEDAEFARETIIKLICKPPLKSKGDELTADLRRVLALLGEK